MRIPLLAVLALTCCAAFARPTAVVPGFQRDGSVLLPNQWSLRPVGRQLAVGDFPVNIALHPDGAYAAVVHSGWGEHGVRIIDLKTQRLVSQVALEETFYGLAWSPRGNELFVSGAGSDVVYVFNFAAGYLSARRELSLPSSAPEFGLSAGFSVSADGESIYVAELWGQRVHKLGTRDGRVHWTRVLAPRIRSSYTQPEGERFTPDNPNGAYPYTCVADPKRPRVYVSLWALATVLVLDSNTGEEMARWPVGPHPNEMTLAADGRLFVSEANHNQVTVIDTAADKVSERLTSALYPNSPPGSTPNSVAVSPDGKTLFVANADNNNVAVFDLAQRGRAISLGYIPVGWFPTSVRVTSDGRTLVVANGKGGTSSANPRGPFPGTTTPRDLQQFIGQMQGTLSFIPLPSDRNRAGQYGAWSKTAYACSPLDAASTARGTRPANSPIPAKVGDASPIKYVLYVIRENRTYDQIFGDVAEGNGDPHLCIFPENVTPNAHALAREFVLLDNFFADGEVSADGHEWTMGAYATDFVERMWPLSYGHSQKHRYDHPAEGRYPAAFPENGYLWNRAAEAGVSFRSYGEFCDTPRRGPVLSTAALPILKGHIDPYYRAWDLDYPDVKRAERLIAELRRFEAEGNMPRLQVVRLGGDHTEGTRPGKLTPTAMVADNDLALGQIVDAVSRLKCWPETAIFVLEDDAQNGPDHVDAHRMPALVISPWTRRHAIDSTLYSTTSMLRTIELILGLQPMSQFDAAAMPMWASFQAKPVLTPFTTLPAQVDLNAVNTRLAWGARASNRIDWSAPDKADDIVLNEIVWRSVRGADSPMPAPVRAAFYKAHPKEDRD